MKVRTADRAAGQAAPRRDGALHLRPPARLPDLPGQRRLRAAGHGRRGRPARGPLRLRRREPPAARRRTSPIPTSPSIPAKCIVCSRCVRACDEIQGTFALTIEGRGFDSQVVAGGTEPFLDSECVSCGACVQACPTAALSEKSRHRAWASPSAASITTCAYCGVGCSFKAEMQGDEVVRMVPYKDGQANHGHSCVKGRFAWGYATHKDRITKPMIRDTINDPWREVTLGRGDRLRGRASSSASRPSTAATRSAASPRRAAPTKRRSSCRSWCARRSATTTSTPARASATRRPATA